jgi:hypothetical protein
MADPPAASRAANNTPLSAPKESKTPKAKVMPCSAT